MSAITLLGTLLLNPALAQEPEFKETLKEVEEIKKPEAKWSAEMGGTLTTGNSDFLAVNGGTNASYRWDQNKLSGQASAALVRSRLDTNGDGRLDDTERQAEREWSSQKITAEARYDRFFGERNSLYLLAAGERDTFGGYDYALHEQLGYSRVLVDTDATDAVAEVGVDYAQEEFVERVECLPGQVDSEGNACVPVEENYTIDDSFPAARVMVGLSHNFSESVSVSDKVEVLQNLTDSADFRLNNEAVLSVKLNETFSLKVSHRLGFDNVPPLVAGTEEHFRKVDQTSMVTFVASIF